LFTRDLLQGNAHDVAGTIMEPEGCAESKHLLAAQALRRQRAQQTLVVQRSRMLPDGTYDAFVLDAHEVDAGVAGEVSVEITVTSGPSKGAVLVLRGQTAVGDPVEMLGLPATLVVRRGVPHLDLGPLGMAVADPRVGASLSPAQRRAMSDQSNEAGAAAAGGEPQHVPVNVYEAERALVVVAPLPGVMADDVSVTVEGGSATIRAAMRTTAEKDYLVHEWHYGPYERRVELPDGFGGKAEASFANGQLALRIERGEGGERQTVTVNASRS
jgi:HSP20 family molecular chaperone IbpA